jgi:hypothetical protein
MKDISIPVSVWFPVLVNSIVVIAGIVINIRIVEKIKSNLSLQTQHKLSIKKLEIEAIFDYNKRLSNWVINLMRYNFYHYNFSNYSKISSDCRNLQNLKKDFVFSESHLELFINDDEFIKARDTLKAIAGNFEVIKVNLARKFHDNVISSYAEEAGTLSPYDEAKNEAFTANYNAAVNYFKDNEPADYKNSLKMTQKAFFEYKQKVNSILLSIEKSA